MTNKFDINSFRINSFVIIKKYVLFILFAIFVTISYTMNISAGIQISQKFWLFFKQMITFLPLIFILVGLIEVWFPKEKVEKHVGEASGLKGSLWIILLAMFQAGPLYSAFPVAYILWKKGTSIRNIFIYLGAFSTIKIPLLTFEIGFMGIKFSLLRSLITLPVFILIAVIIEKYLKGKKFVIKEPK